MRCYMSGYLDQIRSLRENGKLIMLFDSGDLIAMNKMKMEQEDPANYLLDKLDNLLLDLEK